MKDKLILGIDETTNIHELLSDGVRQFYFGYLPQTYSDTYATQTSLNRRYRAKEQFKTLESLFDIIDTIHQKNGIIYLALNAFTSNAIIQEYAQESYELFANKVDGIIVANISMATMLKKSGYEKIVISNLFGVYSTNAVAFLLQQFKPIKIILPRDITLQNIKQIVSAYPKVAFECFLYGDNCRFSESFCFSEHGYDSLGFGSLCSYSAKEKVLLKTANPAFKQIVKNTSLTDEEKKELLSKQLISVEHLLDEIALYSFEFNSKKIAEALETLALFDKEMFYSSKQLYIKAITTLAPLEFVKAQELCEMLKSQPFEAHDNYRVFHKLNKRAILETIAFFQTFENIKSYKIPSRGRNFYKYLDADENEAYNYKQSQYKL